MRPMPADIFPGLAELDATLTTDALQERHAVTREFVRDRFRMLREALAARMVSGAAGGSHRGGHRLTGRGGAGDRRVGWSADPVAPRSRRRGRGPHAVDPEAIGGVLLLYEQLLLIVDNTTSCGS